MAEGWNRLSLTGTQKACPRLDWGSHFLADLSAYLIWGAKFDTTWYGMLLPNPSMYLPLLLFQALVYNGSLILPVKFHSFYVMLKNNNTFRPPAYDVYFLPTWHTIRLNNIHRVDTIMKSSSSVILQIDHCLKRAICDAFGSNLQWSKPTASKIHTGVAHVTN